MDLTRVLAGPFCTMLMADMGAEVIKIEVPETGDDSRQFAPFVNGESKYYMNLNRNKKGITLNLKNPEGRRLFLEMVQMSDMVIENFRPGTMENLGLGYEKLSEVNPGIIYGCISGFGHSGPYKDRAGYDIIGQAMGGLMSITGFPDREPVRTGTSIADILAGLSASVGVLAALAYREKTGRGQKVDIALVDSIVVSLENVDQDCQASDIVSKRRGNRHDSIYPYDSFKTKDGRIVIACGNDKLWKVLCKVMGKAELASDERFNVNPKRVQYHNEVGQIVEEWTLTKTVEEAVDILLTAGIPAGPINTINMVANDPHIAGAREMFVETDHPKAGKIKLTGSHIKLSHTPVTFRDSAPLLGQDNEEIFAKLFNLSQQEVMELKEKGVI